MFSEVIVDWLDATGGRDTDVTTASHAQQGLQHCDNTETPEGWTMPGFMFPDDPIFWFQTQRAFGAASYGCADFGEVFTAAQQIKSQDYDSWRVAWSGMAERVEKEAREMLAAGYTVSGRDGLMRAMTYWRSSEFFTRDRDPHFDGQPLYERSAACFRDAIKHFDPPVVPVDIPYEGTTLNGYLYSSPHPGPQPLAIIHTGFDGTAEEMWIDAACGAQARGYTALAFDGPGQPGPRYRDGLVFRPDWEAVITPVIDFAVQQPGVDQERISLIGNSMGGVLAPRAAAFEPRIKALMAIDGVYDFSVIVRTIAGEDYEKLMQGSDTDLDAAIEQQTAKNTIARWIVRNGMWSFGVDTPAALAREMLKYNLRDGVAERITCPTFVGLGQPDAFFPGQPEALMAHLKPPATLATFTDAEGAGSHCQGGAKRLLNARTFDWLAGVL